MRNPYIAAVLESRYKLTESSLFLEDGFMPQMPNLEQNPQTIFGAFTGGFKKSFDASKEFSPKEIQMYEKMKSTVDPYTKKAIDIANVLGDFLKKWKIPVPLAIAGITAGLMGGIGAVPLGLLVYSVQRMVGSGMEWLVGLKHLDNHHESFSFRNYYQKRMLEEGIYDSAVDLSGRAGKFLGTAAGTASKYWNAFQKTIGSATDNVIGTVSTVIDTFRKDPKAAMVNAAKLAIVVTVAVLAGGVAATAYKLITNPENWGSIASAVAGMGAGSAEEATKALADAAHGHGASAVGSAMDASHGAASHAMGAHDAASHAMGAHDATSHAMGAHDVISHASHGAHGAGHDAFHSLDPVHLGKHAATDAAIESGKRVLPKTHKSLQGLNVGTGV